MPSSSSTCSTQAISTINYVLGHKEPLTNLGYGSYFKSYYSDYNEIELEINSKKIAGNVSNTKKVEQRISQYFDKNTQEKSKTILN